jgi:Domain of unknown function (DUF4440)
MRNAVRRFATLLTAALLSTGCSQQSVKDAAAAQVNVSAQLGHRPDSATEQTILGARDAIWHAWFANDTAQLRQLVPEALAAGETQGSQQRWSDRTRAMNEARQFVTAGGTLITLDFPRTEIHVMGNVAVVLSEYDVQVTTHGTPHSTRGHSTEIFVLHKGHWVNPFWHLESSN